jgi:hypothetical protein
MGTTRTRVVIGAALGVVMAMCFAMPTATAAPPDNDDINSAQVITTLPGRFGVDTREATTDVQTAGFGPPCMGGHNVWFRFQPASDVTARAVTSESDFNPLIGVFTGPPDALRPLTCNDDRLNSEAGVEFQFLRGQTYYIAVSTCCDASADFGGHTVLRMYKPVPLTLSAPTTLTQAGDISGSAVVTGTARCTNPGSLAIIGVTLRQRVGSHVARGGTTVGVFCAPDRGRWSVLIDDERGLAFRPGKARMTISKQAVDGFGTTAQRVATRTVTLQKAPNLRVDPGASSRAARTPIGPASYSGRSGTMPVAVR